MSVSFGDSSLFSEFKNSKNSEQLSYKKVTERKIDNVVLTKSSNGNGDQSKDHLIYSLRQQVDELIQKNANLVSLNQGLMKQLRVVTLCRSDVETLPNDDDPVLQIIYFNTNLSRKLRPTLEEFIINKLNKMNPKEIKLPTLSNRPNFIDLNISDDVEDQKLKVVGSCRYLSGYVLDRMGWPLNEYNPALMHGWDVPRFIQMFNTIHGEHPTLDMFTIKKARSCFNCGGNHSITSCTEDRDYQKIKFNKNNFLSNRTQRYHKEDLSMKYSQFKPGVISEKLRDALGLSKVDLPPYIYKLRTLGYPPGHLQQAHITEPQLIMFGQHGREIAEDGELLEDGELNGTQQDQGSYDAKLFIDYPGFNIPPASETVDNHKKLNMPAMQPHHSKEFMINHLNKHNPASLFSTRLDKRKHQDEVSAQIYNNDNKSCGGPPRKQMRMDDGVVARSADMDIDEGGGGYGSRVDNKSNNNFHHEHKGMNTLNIPSYDSMVVDKHPPLPPPSKPPLQLLAQSPLSTILLPPPPPPSSSPPPPFSNTDGYIIIDDDNSSQDSSDSCIVIKDDDPGDVCKKPSIKKNPSLCRSISSYPSTPIFEPSILLLTPSSVPLSPSSSPPPSSPTSSPSHKSYYIKCPSLEQFSKGISDMDWAREASTCTGNYNKIKDLLDKLKRK